MKRKLDSTTSVPTSKPNLTAEGLDSAKKDALNNLKQRKSSRLAHKTDVQLILTFTSQHAGVATQQLNQQQSIYFIQTATLSLPGNAHAPHDISHYYEFRQEVRDSYTFQAGAAQALTAWAQDGPYQPNYQDPQITVTPLAISFQDEPGYSTTQQIAAGQWLLAYDVYFRWRVTPRYGAGVPWVSPVVHHSVTSPYNGGLNGPVNRVAYGPGQWTVNLPNRPAG